MFRVLTVSEPWASLLRPGPLPGAWSPPLAKRSVLVTLQTAAPSKQRARDASFMGWPRLGCFAGSRLHKRLLNTACGNSWTSPFGVSPGEGGQRLQVPTPRGPLMLAEDNGRPGWIVTYATSFLQRPQQPRLPERRADRSQSYLVDSRG